MSKFIIQGGKPLKGEIAVAGSKNALFPLLAATLLTDEECVLTNVPEITDKQAMVALLQGLGAKVETSRHCLTVRAENLQSHILSGELAGQLRGSIVLVGALLARLGKVETVFPGGDKIGSRPIQAHLAALQALGAQSNGMEAGIILSAGKLTGAKIILEESSVTATENAILAASKASGVTVIKLAAMEPHIQQLCEFLNKMGAKISGIGSPTLVIEGVRKLHGAEIKLIPDSNEAAGLLALAAASKGDVKVIQLDPNLLDDFLLKLKQMNVSFETGSDFVRIHPPATEYRGIKIQCGLYPKLPSDDVPVLAVLATQAQGESLVYEWLYENRLSYVKELQKMGANAEILDPHRVKIIGPTPLKGANIQGLDIRMGMTLIIAALVADGQSEIDGIEHIDRGYEQLEDRLQNLGADIKRVNS